jgi:hypothetical protein
MSGFCRKCGINHDWPDCPPSRYKRLADAREGLELAWGLIANAWEFVEREGGDTSHEWIKAAARWRDTYSDTTTEGELGLRLRPERGKGRFG